MKLCVHCGHSAEDHGPDKRCLSISCCDRTFATMDLPAGKTCHNCHFISYCAALFECKPTNTRCDWFPIRFIERPL